MTATVRDLLKQKGDQVWSIGPETSVLEALELVSEKNVGSLVILENQQLVGIISERYFARRLRKSGDA